MMTPPLRRAAAIWLRWRRHAAAMPICQRYAAPLRAADAAAPCLRDVADYAIFAMR